MNCTDCKDKACYVNGRDCTSIREKIVETYQDLENQKLMKVSAALEAEGYMQLTRVEELIKFSEKMGYKHLGIAFCIGFTDEAATLQDLLKTRFDVSSVCCKVCGLSKDEFRLKKVREVPIETMCNPIGQAVILNQEKTDLNIILGLCMGHDTLFTKNSAAPVTTLVVKDRVLAHNPVGALYSHYWKRKIKEKMTP